MAVLRIQSGPVPTLKEQVDACIEEERQRAQLRVQKWLLFWADLGVTRLFLDDCPGIRPGDFKDIARWLEEEGFRVQVPRLGRITIYLGELDE